MIRFCNEQNAILYVSYLKTPPRFALWNLPANEIRQIREELNEMVFPEKSYVEKSNAQSFHDLITFLQNAEKEAQERNPSEIIPYSLTENDPYSYLPVHTNSAGKPVITGQPSNNENQAQGYDANADYRELLLSRFISEGIDPKNFFEKTDSVMILLASESDKNKVHYAMIQSETQELIKSVLSFSNDELYRHMQEAVN